MADKPGDPKQPDVVGAEGGAAAASAGGVPQEEPTAQVSAGDPGDAGGVPQGSGSEDGESAQSAERDRGGSVKRGSQTAGQESLTQTDLDALLSAAEMSDAPASDAPEQKRGRDQGIKGSRDQGAESGGAHEPAAAQVDTQPVRLPDFSDEQAVNAERDISVLRDVNLKVHIELGRTRMYIEDVLKLTEGSVVELDNLAGDPVDVYVNGRLVARGEVLVLSDNFCIRVSEIVTGPQRVSVA